MSTQTIPSGGAKPTDASAFQTAFIIAWLFCLLFYFMEYAVRSAPSVMLPELRAAFGLNTAGLSSLIGLYYYSYAGFAIVAGASVDRWGAKYTIPAGVLILALGTAMFGVNVSWIAGVGRFLQGAGAAFAFVAAVYLAARVSRRVISRPQSELPNASACSAGPRANSLSLPSFTEHSNGTNSGFMRAS